MVYSLHMSSSYSSIGHACAIYECRCPRLAIEGLRSKAFWSAEDFDLPWVAAFQEGFLDVKEELLALRGRGRFQVRATMPSAASREYVDYRVVFPASHFPCFFFIAWTPKLTLARELPLFVVSNRTIAMSMFRYCSMGTTRMRDPHQSTAHSQCSPLLSTASSSAVQSSPWSVV